MIIVIGASGFLGKRIYAHFSKKNMVLAGTYTNTPTKNLIFFDLMKPDLETMNIDLKKATHMVICSAVTDMDSCKREKERSIKINVDGVKNLLQQSFMKNIFPIFISSDYVYDGMKGNYSEEDKQKPNMQYGYQKMLVEKYLASQKKPFMIARLGKIYSLDPKDDTMLTSWARQLYNNEEIRCATDQIFSPSYVEDIAYALDIAIQKNLKGLYNVVSPESFSRFELASMVKSQLNISSGKIIPCSIKDFNFFDNRPLNTSLKCEKFINATNMKFTLMQDSLEILQNIRLNTVL